MRRLDVVTTEQFQVNGLVTVGVAGDAVELPSRIEDLDDTTLVVAIPPHGPRALSDSGTDEVDLHWVSIRGRYQQPAVVVETIKDPILQWRLEPYGEPQLMQRREYVRLATVLPLRVQHRELVADGTTIDISEGGCRCLVDYSDMEPGSEVMVYVEIEGRQLAIPGQVMRTVRALHARTEVVVVFHHPAQHGDLIRRFVFKMQVRMRGGESA